MKGKRTQTPFTKTKINTVHIGVFTHQPNIFNWNTSIANSKSRCKDDAKYLIDKDSWSLIFEDFFLNHVDELDIRTLEGLPFRVCILMVSVNQDWNIHILMSGFLKK